MAVFNKLIVAGFVSTCALGAQYTYSCSGECFEKCSSGDLTPLINTQERFTKEIMRCGTHSPNANLSARMDGFDLDATRCKGKGVPYRAYIDFPVGMEDLWTFTPGSVLTVKVGLFGHLNGNVTVGFTNSEDPCGTNQIFDIWESQDVRAILTGGRRIGYKKMVFTDISKDLADDITSILTSVSYTQSGLDVNARDSWYMCEHGCCMEDTACSNSGMRTHVTLPTFVEESEKCVATHPGCKFTIDHPLNLTYKFQDVYLCNNAELAIPINFTSPIFEPVKGSYVDAALYPPPTTDDRIKMSILLEDEPCTSPDPAAWMDLERRSDNSFLIKKVHDQVLKTAYGLLRFSNYVPWGINSFYMPVHYGTLSDTSS